MFNVNDIEDNDPACSITTEVRLISFPSGHDNLVWTNLSMTVDSENPDRVNLTFTDPNGVEHDMGDYDAEALKSAADKL